MKRKYTLKKYDIGGDNDYTKKAKKVDGNIPDGYNFIAEQDGKKYYKKSSNISLQQAVPGDGKMTSSYHDFLTKQLSSGVSPEELANKKYISSSEIPNYQQYYKPVEDYVYTEHQPAPQQPTDAPTAAFRGEPIYQNNKLVGLVNYNSRNSNTQSQAGNLNTGYQNSQFSYVDNYGKPTGQVYNIPSDAWNKEFGTTRSITHPEFMQKYAPTPKYPYGGGPLTAEGAKEILRDGTIHGRPLTPAQRKYFGYIAGGGTPKAFDGADIAPIHDKLPSIGDQVPQSDINLDQLHPSYGIEKFNRYSINGLDAINGIATGITAIAQQHNSNRDFRNEQRKYYQELQQPATDSNYTINDNPIYMKDGGKWIQSAVKHPGRCHDMGGPDCPKGSPQYNLAMRFKHHELNYGGFPTGSAMLYDPYCMAQYGIDNGQPAQIEAEGGEVYQNQGGNIIKINDSAPSHEQGGVPLNDVSRVLEDTSTTRKDEMSQALKVTPSLMKGMFGVDTDRSISHSKALELADKYFAKKRAKFNKNINANLDNLDENKDNMYAKNSLKLNTMNSQTIPTRENLFDALFNHQEGIKQDMAQQYQAKYGYADYGFDNDPYTASNTKAGSTTPTGRSNHFDYGSLGDVNTRWKRIAGIDGDKLSNTDFQSKTYDWLLQNNPAIIKHMWQTYGNTAKGKKEGINADFSNLSTADLQKLKSAYVDGQLGARTLVPPTEGDDIVKRNTDISYSTPSLGDRTPNMTIGVPQQDQPAAPQFNIPKAGKDSPFHEPLNWYDLAGPLMTLTSADRIPAKYNPVEFNQVRLKLQNPEPSLAAGQQQYNQASSLLTNPSDVSNLYSAKYANDNQVLGNYENINSQIKNQEVLYNAGVKDRQSAQNAQSRQTFEQQMLGSKEAERQQKLSAFDDLFTRIAMNRKLNREGSLLMHLFPNYNQEGEYNGNQRYVFGNTQGSIPTGSANSQFQILTDPQTGARYRVAYDKNGKMISSSKIITDDKAIGSKGR